MMKFIKFYSLPLIIFIINNKTTIAQQSKNNLSASIGLSLPYSPSIYSAAAINSTVEYLGMFDLSNGLAFHIDIVEFRNLERGLKAQIMTFRAGYRRRFTEKFYSQFSVGSSQIGQTRYYGFSGSGELRSGFLFAMNEKYNVDLSCFVSQTTKEFGWVGLKLGLMYSFKKKKKKVD